MKHRKIFYVPGMVSLVFIPFLFFCYLYFKKPLKEERGMDLGLPDKVGDIILTNDSPIFTRNYKDFAFNGSIEEDQNIINSFQKSLRYQNTVKDTVNGIKLHFGKQMKYEVFIRILDILALEKTPTYIIDKNQMLIVIGSKSDNTWYYRKLKEKFKKEGIVLSKSFCGNPAIEAAQMESERENREAMQRENLRKSYFNNHWYLFLAYFCLALLNIFMLIKFNKNRIYNQKSYI